MQVSLDENEWSRLISMVATHLVNQDPVMAKVVAQLADQRSAAAAGDSIERGRAADGRAVQ